ncbi:MAG TPA: tryptophan--tRNA ligase [Solirubrobacteraceae bacterium]|jgi:tryptophanyl-tRNA synthetase|nr:tryptophan--tRNA ligase [Solirubrobacteraceae bacterium]
MRIFSGVQPTGRKHLGNYIGAFVPHVASQERGEGIYCIVDLHATTVAYEPARLRTDVYDLQAVWMAAGLDPQRCVLFRQSDVTEHSELQWLLNSVTGYGELSRMTQFKDKSTQQDFISAGIFNYPILMVADILLYKTDEVPVGDDQRQHVELTRDVAHRFNSRFGETFVVPEVIIREVGARIMDLQAPEKKMSTTGGTPQGTVYVTDQPGAIIKKFKSAVTDSGREIRYSADREKAGIRNLLEILSIARGASIPELEREFDGAGYGDFKLAVGEAVVEYLAPVRERYDALRADERGLEETLRVGAEKARAIAVQTMLGVRASMGVGPVGPGR